MSKIAFLGNAEHPSRLLETFRKMTPGKSGKWGQLEGTGNIEEADYFACIDRIPSDYRSKVREDKCITLGAHPESVRAYQNMASFRTLAKFDCAETIGFLEWWIKYDYDYLSALQPMTKTKLLGTIVSNAETDNSHRVRKAYLQRICQAYSGKLDVYGRIIPTGSVVANYKGACGNPCGSASIGDYWSGKEAVYESYKYMLEFDNVGENYFSERVLDCMLLWAMPIYWGGKGVHKVLPDTSFRYINIDGNGEDVMEVVNSDFYEKNIDSLAKSRDILLNQLQLWPRVHAAIYGVSK
jgi:hypothetical protein